MHMDDLYAFGTPQAPTPAVYASVWLPTFVSPHACRSKEEGLSAFIINNIAYVRCLVGIQVPNLCLSINVYALFNNQYKVGQIAAGRRSADRYDAVQARQARPCDIARLCRLC
jgi:hypothetical protein